MKLILGAIIATSLIIFLGTLVISPIFLMAEKSTPVMLSFNIYDTPNLESWCQDLSYFLSSENISGTIFISGKLAEKYPICINSFPENFDVGSRTFSYVQLPQIPDYSIQLEEVQKGKETINKIGKIESKLFKAPFGDTDENIYSILSRNEIYADFSYQNQYNKFYENQFLKFDLLTYDSQQISVDLIQDIETSKIPIQIEFDTNNSLEEIKKTINEISTWKIEFVNASNITKMGLTLRN